MTDNRYLYVEHSTDKGKHWEVVRIVSGSLVNANIPALPHVYDDMAGNLYRRIERTG